MELYRSGHNEAVLKTVCLVRDTWVRIPPAPPKIYKGVAKPNKIKGLRKSGKTRNRNLPQTYHKPRQFEKDAPQERSDNLRSFFITQNQGEIPMNKKDYPKTKRITIRLNEIEYDLLESYAQKSGETLEIPFHR